MDFFRDCNRDLFQKLHKEVSGNPLEISTEIAYEIPSGIPGRFRPVIPREIS